MPVNILNGWGHTPGAPQIWEIQRQQMTMRRKPVKSGNYANQFSVTLNQLIFVTFCSETYLQSSERLTSVIYGLLFCHVLTYSGSYLKEILTRKDWDLSIRIGPTSNVKHFALTSINVGLEWTKFITFLVTIISFLLVLGASEGFGFLETPSLKYMGMTLTYYSLTEPRIKEIIPNVLLYLPSNLEVMRGQGIEGLESVCVDILVRGFGIALSCVILIPLLFRPKWMAQVCLALIINVGRPWKAFKASLHTLQVELDRVKEFREAELKEINDYEDVCSICLGRMTSSARITPCQHYFHPNCLRLYLKSGQTCPVCKRYLYP